MTDTPKDRLDEARQLVAEAEAGLMVNNPTYPVEATRKLMLANTLAQIDMAESLRLIAYSLPDQIQRAIMEGLWSGRQPNGR